VEGNKDHGDTIEYSPSLLLDSTFSIVGRSLVMTKIEDSSVVAFCVIGKQNTLAGTDWADIDFTDRPTVTCVFQPNDIVDYLSMSFLLDDSTITILQIYLKKIITPEREKLILYKTALANDVNTPMDLSGTYIKLSGLIAKDYTGTRIDIQFEDKDEKYFCITGKSLQVDITDPQIIPTVSSKFAESQGGFVLWWCMTYAFFLTFACTYKMIKKKIRRTFSL